MNKVFWFQKEKDRLVEDNQDYFFNYLKKKLKKIIIKSG